MGLFHLRAYLRNYDDNALEDVHHLPDGAIKVQIGLGQYDGPTVPEVLAAVQAREVSSSNEVEPGAGTA